MDHETSISSGYTTRRSVVIASVIATLLALLALNLGRSPGAGADQATPAACPTTPEAHPSPVVGTPDTIQILCVATEPGTPVAVDALGVTVTLTASSTKAGPVDLTIELIAEDGEPVNDATVSIKTRHLEMDHGESTDETVYLGDGRYVAERVSMGMGGTWKTTVVIARPGLPPIELIFAVALSGPEH